MSVLDFGGLSVSVTLDKACDPALARFVSRTANKSCESHADLNLHVLVGPDTQLVVDDTARRILLTVPVTPGPGRDHTIAIAVLQAAARGLAYIASHECALLHGGAVLAAPSGPGIAILDGGRGQGKTSLAIALARLGGQLVADEFLFATAVGEAVVMRSAPRLPWHIRADMAPYLVPPGEAPLVFPTEIGLAVAPPEWPVVIDTVVIPDASQPAGAIHRAPLTDTGHLLACAVSDHRAKLVDPGLDHVSLFSSPAQIRAVDGRPLAARERPADHARQVLDRLARRPVYRVGIGGPADIAASAAATMLAVVSR